MPASRIAMNASSLYRLVDGRDKTLGGCLGGLLVVALQRVAHGLELIFDRRKTAAIDEGAAFGLTCAFGCGFGIGHDFGFLRKRTGRIAAPQPVSSGRNKKVQQTEGGAIAATFLNGPGGGSSECQCGCIPLAVRMKSWGAPG